MNNKRCVIGAIVGDIIGSIYEDSDINSYDFSLFTNKSDFTDDSVLTIATMDCLLKSEDYATMYKIYARKFPDRGYGMGFTNWLLKSKPFPYNSCGNGSAMRVSPIAWYYESLDDVLAESKKSAECTHNHPEGIRGAQAIATCVFLARHGYEKKSIKSFINQSFGYDLNRNIENMQPDNILDSTCQHTVPKAIIAFVESSDFEDAIRLAVSMGGDCDTIASMTGAIAEAYYKHIPQNISCEITKRIPSELLDVIHRFSDKVLK